MDSKPLLKTYWAAGRLGRPRWGLSGWTLNSLSMIDVRMALD
jgi:hypothetical protein